MIAPAVIAGIAALSAYGKYRSAKTSNDNRNQEFMKKTTPFGGQQSEDMITGMRDYYANLVSPEGQGWSLGQFSNSRNMLGNMQNRYFPGMQKQDPGVAWRERETSGL